MINLGWLPMKERRDWHLLKSAHKAVDEAIWSTYIKLETVSHSRLLRSGKGAENDTRSRGISGFCFKTF